MRKNRRLCRTRPFVPAGVHPIRRSEGGLLLPAATALAGFMLLHVGSHKPELWATTWHWAWRAAELSVVSGICSAALALYTVLPKQQHVRSGLIAFRGITDNHSRDYYIAAVNSLTDPISEVAGHSYDLAKILRRKYRALIPAMWAFLLAGLAAVATLVAR